MTIARTATRAPPAQATSAGPMPRALPNKKVVMPPEPAWFRLMMATPRPKRPVKTTPMAVSDRWRLTRGIQATSQAASRPAIMAPTKITLKFLPPSK
ncbi:hypothetical protein D3C72_1562080 [compost metagenome]